MDDPLENLTDAERAGWAQLVRHVRRELIGKIDKPPIAIMPVLDDEPDAYSALQLGMCLLLGKPLLLITAPGVAIPDSLRRAADTVVEADTDTVQGRTAIALAIARMTDAAVAPDGAAG